MSMLASCLTICGISVLAATVTEVVSYVLIYRKEDYKRLKADIERTHKQLEKTKKEVAGLETQKKVEKRVARLEAELRDYNQKLAIMRSRSTILLALVMLGLHTYLSRVYAGVVVAKLPFEPIAFFQKLTHRTLEGDDFTDCSFSFIYVLCSLALRSNFQKAFGQGTPKGSNPNALFELPQPQSS